MKTNTTVLAMIVAIVAMIGMTGFASAGSTTQTYVGDGSYTTSWNGYHGTMDIDTYTSNGHDHLAVDYQNGRTHGDQTGDTNTWTKVERRVSAGGQDTSISTATIDNSGDLIAIDASAKRGRTRLGQTVILNDDTRYNAIVSMHQVNARGYEYGVSVVALAGYNPNDDTYGATTVVDLDGKGCAGIVGIAGVGNNNIDAASGQAFRAYAREPGEADITAQGDNAGVGSFRMGAMQLQNDGTRYSARADGETYINLHDDHNYRYDAAGYIYAVDLNSGTEV